MTIEVVEFIQGLQNGFFDFFFNFISFLGEEYIYISIAAIIYYAYDKKLGELLAFSLFTTALVNTSIKGLVGALRPFEKYPDRVQNLRPDTAGGHSFPSGHTQQFTTVLFTLSLQIKKNWVFIVAAVLSVLMALSRMYLGVHFLEDVTVSIILGIGLAFLFHFLYKKYKDMGKMNIVYGVILVIFLPFVIIINDKDILTSYGMMIGLLGAMVFEQRFVQFSTEVSLLQKVIRVAIGIIIMISIQLGVKLLFIAVFGEDIYILDMIRYMLISFVGLGLYPLSFKLLKF